MLSADTTCLPEPKDPEPRRLDGGSATDPKSCERIRSDVVFSSIEVVEGSRE